MVECQLRYNLFSEEDIIGFLKESFQINLEKQRLIKPDRQLMIDILSKFADYLKIEGQSMEIEACQGISNLGDLDGFYRLSNLANIIHNLLEQTNFTDFSVADIISPKRKRNQKIFSQLIALFISFYEIEQKWLELNEQYQSFPGQKMIAMNQINGVRAQIEKMSLELTHLQKNYKPLKEEQEMLSNKLKELEAIGPQLDREKVDCKTRISAEREAISGKEMQKTDLKNQIELEKLKIVICPEKILESVQQKESELNHIREKYKQVRLEIMDLKNNLCEMERNEEELKRIQGLINEENELCGKIEEMIGEMQSMDEKFKNSDIQIDDFQLSCQKTEKHISLLENDLQQTINHHRTEMKPITLHNNRLKGILDSKRNELNTCKAKKVDFGELDEERSLIRQKQDVLRQIHLSTQQKFNAFVDEMSQTCQELNL